MVCNTIQIRVAAHLVSAKVNVKESKVLDCLHKLTQASLISTSVIKLNHYM